MSSSDKSANGGTKPPANPGDDAVLVISIDERQFMWVAVAVVALFVAINGIALLTWESSGSQFAPPPFEDGSYPAPPSGSGQLQGGAGQGAAQPSTSPGADMGERDRTPRSEGGYPNNDSMAVAKGDEALGRVKAFATDFDLDEEAADALVSVVEQTNAAVGALDTRLASGDIDLTTHSAEVIRHQEIQQTEILRLLGPQRSSNLLERLRSPSSRN